MKSIAELEGRLGYHFRDETLINTALTHPSYGGDHAAAHYQRLEFLGDAVLELAVSRYLYLEKPDFPEGQLTRLRASLVREETLCEVARELGLGPCILLSAGEEKSGGRDKPSILSDVMEAVIAAVYLDGGAEAAFSLVQRALGKRLGEGAAFDALDYKTRLQEHTQQHGGSMPEYRLVSTDGPAHQPVFTVEVLLDGAVIGRGSGKSKRDAQQEAAREALASLAGP